MLNGWNSKQSNPEFTKKIAPIIGRLNQWKNPIFSMKMN